MLEEPARRGAGVVEDMDLQPLDLADEAGHPRALSLEEIADVARRHRPVAPLREDPEDWRPLERAMAESTRWVHETLAGASAHERTVYGLNTGFGALAGHAKFHSRYHARVLQRNLLVSHAAGAGPALDADVVRAAALVRASQLVRGCSGVRISVVNRLLALLNAGVYVRVPSMGSLGASGDLAPLAYLALAISRAPEPESGDDPLPVDDWEGEAWLPLDEAEAAALPGAALRWTEDEALGQRRAWRRASCREAVAPLGGALVLEAKEALALTNGATFSCALAALALEDMRRLYAHAELALAMSLEAARGFRDAFLPELHAARGLPGQAAVAARVLVLTDGSELLDGDRDRDPERTPPQDPYSLRCAPQVLGAGREAMAFAERIVRAEANAAVDNPLIFLDLPRGDKAVSGGNFHGAPIGYALDLLKIAMTDCASISERRCYLLTDYHFDDPFRHAVSLPRFLAHPLSGPPGLNSGLMIPQYTAASLVSACKTLAHPDSVDSIPSSAGQEDHVSMSMNAGHHARSIAAHAESVIAIELLMAAQALDLRAGEGRPGRGTAAAHARLRQEVAPLGFDRALHPDLVHVRRLVRSGELLAAAEAAIR